MLETIHRMAIVTDGARAVCYEGAEAFTALRGERVAHHDDRAVVRRIACEHVDAPSEVDRPMCSIEPSFHCHGLVCCGSSFGECSETRQSPTSRQQTCGMPEELVGISAVDSGDTEFGNLAQLGTNVHAGENQRVDAFVRSCPFKALDTEYHTANDVRNKSWGLVATLSMAMRDVAPERAVRGAPARSVGPAASTEFGAGSGATAFSWTEEFGRGFPDEAARWWGAISDG